ncbi:MAG: hypothetical protein OEU46_08530 [Alphaproteobacteria bacterium]|nr:hypothetical protein [Alphaproteobacteria bacterium]
MGCWVHKHPNGKDFVVTPHSWGLTPTPGKMGLISDTMTAMIDSRRALVQLGRLNRQHFFLLNDIHASVEAYWPHENQCWMEAGPRAGMVGWRSDRRSFKGSVAHEVGHCFLMENIPGYKPATARAIDRWWDESGAEFLSALVYKDLNHEHGHAMNFDLDLWPFTQPYGAYVLLQHYANASGDQAVIKLLRQMFRRRTETQLRAYLRSIGFDAVFHDFAATHYRSRVADPGGGNIPREEVVGSRHIEDLSPSGSDVHLSAMNHSRLGIAELTIPAKYNLAISPPEHDSVRLHNSLLNGASLIANWNGQVRIGADCDNRRDIKLLITHLGDNALDDLHVSYRLTLEPECEERPPTPADEVACIKPGRKSNPANYGSGLAGCMLRCADRCWCDNKPMWANRPVTLAECNAYYPGGTKSHVPTTGNTICGGIIRSNPKRRRPTTAKDVLGTHCQIKCSKQCGATGRTFRPASKARHR